VNNKLDEYLGEVDKDLADFIMENIAERNKPDTMVDGLEPVSPICQATAQS
jgi:RNA-binding protein 25